MNQDPIIDNAQAMHASETSAEPPPTPFASRAEDANPATTRHQVAIVIVNYRTTELVGDCLESIAADSVARGQTRVLVVDNDSGGDAVPVLQAYADRWRGTLGVEVLPAGVNGGFAAGNNVGLRHLLEQSDGCEHILLLNPDTVVEPGAVTALSGFLDRHPQVGIVGSRLIGPDGTIDSSANAAPSPLTEFLRAARLGSLRPIMPKVVISTPPRDHAHVCDWVSGAALMIRRSVIDQVGLMDEGFFLYFEETDLCLRASRAGWEVWHVPESRIVHLEGAATGINATARRRPGYWFDSRRRFFRKHYGFFGWLTADLLWVIGCAIRPLRKLFRPGEKISRDPPSFTKDLILGDWRALTQRH